MNKSIGVLKYLAVITLTLIVNSVVSPGCSFAANRYNGSTVKSIAIQDGILWCATDEGVLRLDSATGEQRLYTTEDGLPDKSIATVAVSRVGDVWAGSFKGVVQLSGETWTKVVLPANQSLAETMRIVFAPKGNIWICTPVIQYQYNGLIWLSWALENVQRYSTFFDVDIDSGGTAWFGTMMGVLSYHDYSWTNYTANPTGPGMTEINAIAVDAGGTVWCGTNNSIYRFENGVWTQFGQDGLYGPRVLEIATDTSGVVWASTTGQQGGGISRYIDGSWRPMIPASETGGSAPVCIEFGNEMDMWTGSTAGLFRFDLTTLSVGALDDAPRMTSIIGNYPNPFNPETVIYYEVPEFTRQTQLSIFNLTGQKIRSLVNGIVSAGTHSVLWDGCDDAGSMVASGMYLASLTTGNHRATHRMTLLR